jgi:hypothetical protein
MILLAQLVFGVFYFGHYALSQAFGPTTISQWTVDGLSSFTAVSFFVPPNCNFSYYSTSSHSLSPYPQKFPGPKKVLLLRSRPISLTEMSTTGRTTTKSATRIRPARRQTQRHTNLPSMPAKSILSRRPLLPQLVIALSANGKSSSDHADNMCSLSGRLREYCICTTVGYNLETDVERCSRCNRNSCRRKSQLRELYIQVPFVCPSFFRFSYT